MGSSCVPVCVSRELAEVTGYYNNDNVAFRFSADMPVVALPVGANDDPTSLEVLDRGLMAVRQVCEDGTVHTVCLSPALAIQVARLVDAFVFFPEGIPS